jgi:hypothetical protein
MADNKLHIKITADGKQAVAETGQAADSLGSIGQNAQESSGGLAGLVDTFAPLGKAALGVNELAEALGRIIDTPDAELMQLRQRASDAATIVFMENRMVTGMKARRP